jgi:hypothetical protein
VRLVHRGWESLGEAAQEKRADYDRGWEPILTRDFARHLANAR